MDDQVQEQIERTADLLVGAQHAIALTGAGMSTESGIPDFRGPSGVWTKNPEAEREAYRTYPRLMEDPAQWWKDLFAKDRPDPLRGMASREPNRGHYALLRLEELGILKCTITQNVDGLHEKAGTQRLLEYHGSTSKLRCLACNSRYSRAELDLERLRAENRLPPICPACQSVVKPDVVFFGEPIPADVAEESDVEARKCDVMLVCGTSAVVYPFAALPRIAGLGGLGALASMLPSEWQRPRATVIEVNAEPTPLTEEGISAFLIQGKTGEILPAIAAAVERRTSSDR